MPTDVDSGGKQQCALAVSSRGAPVVNAVAAGVGVGIYKDYGVVKDWVQLGAHTVPSPKNHARYRKLYNFYRDLYPALKDFYVRFAEAIQ